MKTLLTTILLLAAFNPVASNYNRLTFEARAKELYFLQSDFAPETLKVYLHFCGISNAGIVFKQAKLETSHFKSGIFKKHNNLFGMKLANKRETTATGFILADFGKVATYSHWTESVKDYALWQSVQSAKFSTENYYYFLELSGYATNPEYNRILKQIK